MQSAEYKSVKHALVLLKSVASFQLFQVLLFSIFNWVATKYLLSKIFFHWYGAYLISSFYFQAETNLGTKIDFFCYNS